MIIVSNFISNRGIYIISRDVSTSSIGREAQTFAQIFDYYTRAIKSELSRNFSTFVAYN